MSAAVGRASAQAREGAASLRWPNVLDVVLPLVVLLVISAPALFTRSGFVDDWVNHLWLASLESHAISSTGHPSLFMNVEPMGVFYPNFAFYGGTLYGLAGYLMALTGAPAAVFVGFIVLAFCGAYFGTLSIARQAGVSGRAAHLPATVAVTGAYYLSDAYGRGSWPELLATSALPVVAAAALAIVRRGATPARVLVLAGATVLWSGSHNLSFLYGGIFLATMALAVLAGWARRPDAATRRNLLFVLSTGACAVMINAWFLAPDLAYSLHTEIAQFKVIDTAISSVFSNASIVFNPFRARATDAPYLRSHFTELPVLLLAWLVIGAGMTWRRRWARGSRGAFLVIAAYAVVLTALLLDESIWTHLPADLRVIQFTFRLETYIVFAFAALTILTLKAVLDAPAGRLRSVLAGSLVAIVLLGVVLAGWQVWNSSAYYYSPANLTNRSTDLAYRYHTPPTWYEIGQLRDVSETVVPTVGTVRLDPARIQGESTSQVVAVPPGSGFVASNIAASQHLVAVKGMRVAGRTPDGFLALERPPNGARSVRLTVTRADSAPMRYGPWVTLLGAIGVLALSMLALSATSRRQGGRIRAAGRLL